MSHQPGYKIDLHTHSYGSPDGGLRLRDYRYFLQNDLLDYIAITDHSSIETACRIRMDLGELGDRIIVGEEITTTKGEIIGLFLTETIPAGLTPTEAIRKIRSQGGVVYIPHPFEAVRSGVALQDLEDIAKDVDIIETANGRAVFQNCASQAQAWAKRQATAQAASSDAHGRFGWGRTYSVIDQRPNRQNLADQLQRAVYSTRKVGMVGVSYPKLNRLRKHMTRKGKTHGTI